MSMMLDLQLKGEIIVLDGRGRELQRTANLITTRGKEAALLGLLSEFQGMRYMALGAGQGTASAGDAALDDERVRVRITRGDVAAIGSTPTLTIEAQFISSSAAFHIREIGLFGGGDASASRGSGLLFNRASLNIDNSVGGNDLTILARITAT